jgi:hypothetical protein
MLGVGATIFGCRAQSDGPAPIECAPVTTDLPPTGSTEALAGAYDLRLVATSGSKSDSAVDGTLTLQPHVGQLRYRKRLGGGTDSAVVHPYYGSADIDLAGVDAIQVGSTTSADPMQPGVLVIESRRRQGQAPGQIVLRLGADANRQDRQRVDGGYTALRVRQLSQTGFSGTWGSGITGERSAGYFCARKTEKD